jgi:hypothetical protein
VIKAALDTVNSIIAKGAPWTDPDFKPVTSSLYLPGEAKSKKDFEWKRASEFYKDNLNVFTANISPSDIEQG